MTVGLRDRPNFGRLKKSEPNEIGFSKAIDEALMKKDLVM